jgi:hypothetical protein
MLIPDTDVIVADDHGASSETGASHATQRPLGAIDSAPHFGHIMIGDWLGAEIMRRKSRSDQRIPFVVSSAGGRLVPAYILRAEVPPK